MKKVLMVLALCVVAIPAFLLTACGFNISWGNNDPAECCEICCDYKCEKCDCDCEPTDDDD